MIDLSSLNGFLRVETFKMETPETIRASLHQGEWVTSIDLTDAYLHVPIHPRDQKFLRFEHRGDVFQFSSLPFGLATAPSVFTRLAKEVKLMALAKGIRIHVYLDDWLIRADSPEEAARSSQEVVALVSSLGWMINYKKSELIPTQTFNFVGYQYDLSRALVRPTQDRWSKLQSVISSANSHNVIAVRKLMSLLGLLASTEKMVPLRRLHMRLLQWHLKRHWHVPMSLNRSISWTNQAKKAAS